MPQFEGHDTVLEPCGHLDRRQIPGYAIRKGGVNANNEGGSLMEGYAKPSLWPVLEFAREFLVKLPDKPH